MEREKDVDEVKLVQLCVDASTWNMVAILGLGRIQVKGESVRIMTNVIRLINIGSGSFFFWINFESELDSSFLYSD